MTRVLFVCLGNICRSPAAEAVFLRMLKEQGLENQFVVDSAGTSGYHDGEKADSRMIEQASTRGIEVPSISRQFTAKDFREFDHIIVMDDSNYKNVVALDPKGQYESKVSKLTDYASEKYQGFDHVPDPYFGGEEGFDLVLDLLEDCCANLLNKVRGTF
ncbi:MAG: low molecular weight protein-tyrosine-phosphatase [Bacteriovoracaceae bacterium]